MSDKSEPLAAILAEMRDDRIIRLDGADVTRCLLHNLADRIEAAAEREAIDAELKWTRIGYDEREAEEKRAPGNAAALREALKQAKRDHWYDMSPDLRNKIFAALAAPPRNCDRPFRSVNEAIGAYVGERGDGPHLGYCDAIKWTLAPTEKGGAS